jgi:hypothetical protein
MLGPLLADVAINLNKSSKCEVPSSFKDLVDTATTARGAGAAAFTAFLAVLCLMDIMSLAEEYESLSSRMEEDKGDCPLLNQLLIPTVAALLMPPVAVALTFMEGKNLTGTLHFNGAFMIPFLYSILPITLYESVMQYQLQDLAISSIRSFLQILLGAGALCALGKRSFKVYHSFQI